MVTEADFPELGGCESCTQFRAIFVVIAAGEPFAVCLRCVLIEGTEGESLEPWNDESEAKRRP